MKSKLFKFFFLTALCFSVLGIGLTLSPAFSKAQTATTDPDTCTHPTVTEGVCTDCSTVVSDAKVTVDGQTTYFTTLQEAIQEANGKTATVTLLKSYTVPKVDDLTESLFSIDGGDITLDIGSHSFYSSFYNQQGTAYQRIFNIENASFSVVGNGSNWTVNGLNSAQELFHVFDSQFSIKGLNINTSIPMEECIYSLYSTVTVEDVTFHSSLESSNYDKNFLLATGSNVILNRVNLTAVNTQTAFAVSLLNNSTASLGEGSYNAIFIDNGIMEALGNSFDNAVADGSIVSSIENPAEQPSNGKRFNNVVIVPCTHEGEATTFVSNGDGTHSERYENCNGIISAETVACSGGQATCLNKAVCSVCLAEYGDLDNENHTEEAITHPNKNGTHAWFYPCCITIKTENEACTYPTDEEYVDGTTLCTLCEIANLSAATEESTRQINAAIEAKEEAAKNNVYLAYNPTNIYTEVLSLYDDLYIDFATTAEDVEIITANTLAAFDFAEKFSIELSKIMSAMQICNEDYFTFFLFNTDDIFMSTTSLIMTSGLFDEQTTLEKNVYAAETTLSFLKRIAGVMYTLDRLEKVIIVDNEYVRITLDQIFRDIILGEKAYELEQLLFNLIDPDLIYGQRMTDFGPLTYEQSVMAFEAIFDQMELFAACGDSLANEAFWKNEYEAEYIFQELTAFYTYSQIFLLQYFNNTEFNFISYEEFAGYIYRVNEFNIIDLLNYLDVCHNKALKQEDVVLLQMLPFGQYSQFCFGDFENTEHHLSAMDALEAYYTQTIQAFKDINASDISAEEKLSQKEALMFKVYKATEALFNHPEDYDYDEEAFLAALDPCNVGLHLYDDLAKDWTGHTLSCTRCHTAKDTEQHAYGNDLVCDICGFAGVAGVEGATVNENGHLVLTLDDGTVIDAGYAVGPKGDNGVDGDAGENGREIELKRENDTVMWRYAGDDEWKELASLALPDDGDEPEKKKGCKGIASASAAILSILALGGAIALKKRIKN